MMSEAQIIEASHLFSVLAEPTRLRIVKHLMSGPLTVGELVEKLGMKQGSVSKQLGLLHDAHLLKREREGNFIRYAIADPILEPLCRLVCDRIERVARDHAKAVGAFSV
ncbi:MAG: ArsR/SmtB family transcription factor [Limisphaerales bacterium]